MFSLKKVVVFFRHQNVGPFRALRTHHGGYITPPSAHRGGPPGRDVTTERASWISTVPTTTNKPPEVFGCYWMQLEDERVLLFCCFFLCVLCTKVRFKCVVFFNHVFVVRELVDYEKFPKIPKQSFISKSRPWNLCWNEQEPKSLLRKSLKRLVLPFVKSKKVAFSQRNIMSSQRS